MGTVDQAVGQSQPRYGMGGIGLADRSQLKALTGIDDRSGFCVLAGLMPRATSGGVRALR
jgi:hypothetical protein